MPADAPVAERRNSAHLGTAIAGCSGEGLVVVTGEATAVGQIARSLRSADSGKTPLQRRMDRLAKLLAGLVCAAAPLAFVVGLAAGYPRGETFLFAVALAVSAMPAGLPVVMTVALAVGVGRMARRNAVVQRLPAVETLGSTTVIVSDKTSTLTQNRIGVEDLRPAPGADETDLLAAAVATMCPGVDKAWLLANVESMAAGGLRVLAATSGEDASGGGDEQPSGLRRPRDKGVLGRRLAWRMVPIALLMAATLMGVFWRQFHVKGDPVPGDESVCHNVPQLSLSFDAAFVVAPGPRYAAARVTFRHAAEAETVMLVLSGPAGGAPWVVRIRQVGRNQWAVTLRLQPVTDAGRFYTVDHGGGRVVWSAPASPVSDRALRADPPLRRDAFLTKSKGAAQ